jgi:signal transduction histidine kinase
MVSEYRALRSSVLRLWLSEESDHDAHLVTDMIRFNESIDQALAESIASYSQAVDTTRKTVLGVLGHAVLMAGDLIRLNDNLPKRDHYLATQICVSARRANQMVRDLLDLARDNIGTGIPVNAEHVQLNPLCPSRYPMSNHRASLTRNLECPARL